MPSEPLLFADVELAQKTARKLYPDAKHITLVDHAYDNIVVLIDKAYALRFPRNKEAFVRSRYEKTILSELDAIHGVKLPKVLGEHANPPCLITSFLSGTHLTANDIRNWTAEEQTAFGQHVGNFAHQMHAKLSVDEARALRQKLRLDEQAEEPWDRYFAKLFRLNILPPEQQTIAEQYYEEWQKLETNPAVVLHDDLHTENMLFEQRRLTGILDFGDTNIGSPEQELRQLYRISDTALVAAVHAYEQPSGIQLNVRAIQIWAIMQELAVYIESTRKERYDFHGFARASANLNRWLSTDIWGKGLIPDNVAIRQ